jgi:hypothetical protein
LTGFATCGSIRSGTSRDWRNMASVTVSLGYTMNVGNFESLRMDYSITEDVKSDETVDEAVRRVEDKVENFLVERVKKERDSE